MTAIVSAGLLAALAFFGILLGIGRLNLLNVVLAVTLANALAPFAGMPLQKLLPRYTDLSDLHIVGLAGSPLARAASAPRPSALRALRGEDESRQVASSPPLAYSTQGSLHALRARAPGC